MKRSIPRRSYSQLMNIGDLLSPERVAEHADVTSKKRVLELLAEMIAGASPQLSRSEVFESLLNRERLGSTGLGRGVALPHGRLTGIQQTIGAFIRLTAAVNFDAPDDQPVDLLFALIVPEQCTDTHLQMLAQLAEMFGDQHMLKRLRSAQDTPALLTAIRAWQPEHQAAF